MAERQAQVCVVERADRAAFRSGIAREECARVDIGRVDGRAQRRRQVAIGSQGEHGRLDEAARAERVRELGERVRPRRAAAQARGLGRLRVDDREVVDLALLIVAMQLDRIAEPVGAARRGERVAMREETPERVTHKTMRHDGRFEREEVDRAAFRVRADERGGGEAIDDLDPRESGRVEQREIEIARVRIVDRLPIDLDDRLLGIAATQHRADGQAGGTAVGPIERDARLLGERLRQIRACPR